MWGNMLVLDESDTVPEKFIDFIISSLEIWRFFYFETVLLCSLELALNSAVLYQPKYCDNGHELPCLMLSRCHATERNCFNTLCTSLFSN